MTCSDLGNCDEVVGDFAAEVQHQLVGTLQRCDEDLAQTPGLAGCTERIRRFAPAWLEQHDQSSYGFQLGTHDYLGAQTGPDTPSGMMDLPSELFAAWPDRAKLERLARSRGWPYLEHASGLGGSRLFLTRSDPDGRFDQWLTFGFDPTASAITFERSLPIRSASVGTPFIGEVVSFVENASRDIGNENLAKTSPPGAAWAAGASSLASQSDFSWGPPHAQRGPASPGGAPEQVAVAGWAKEL